MDSAKAASAASLLERVASGELDARDALREWPEDPIRDDLIDRSRHDLSHVAADDDIRQKESTREGRQSVSQERRCSH